MIMNTRTVSKRFIDFGFLVGFLQPGLKNTISDVPGITVGHVTKIHGDRIRTGITLIDPGVENLFQKKLPAAIYVGNGFGKLTGTTQLTELGTLETPIALTNTLAVGPVMRGIVDLVLHTASHIAPHETINAVVGETNDGFLNDIHADTIAAIDVEDAFRARSSAVDVGAIGAGTGTRAFSWKGGIGMSSRIVPAQDKKYVLGVLVQTNFGGSLHILGVPIGDMFGKSDFGDEGREKPDGSCMIVVATDAPLSARQLERVAKRAFFGIVRTGSIAAHGSGDYAIAFSTDRSGLEGLGAAGICLSDSMLNHFFLAAADAVEEAVYDALFAAETRTGRDGNTLEALPKDKVIAILEKEIAERKKS